MNKLTFILILFPLVVYAQSYQDMASNTALDKGHIQQINEVCSRWT